MKMSDTVALIQGTSASYLNVTATYKPASDTLARLSARNTPELCDNLVEEG